MATLQNGSIPTVKLDPARDERIKSEPMDEDMPTPYMEEGVDPDDEEDLDFAGAKQSLLLGQMSRHLWGMLSKLGTSGDPNEEIEVGTIRIEGPENTPHRVSLLLNNNVPQFANQHKEYNLFRMPPDERRAKRPGQALVFSEQDKPGYKARNFTFDEVDGDGNPTQVQSKLYQSNKRAQKRKENKDNKERFTPYPDRRIPKRTAIAGAVTQEYQIQPVKNNQYLSIEAAQTGLLLKQREKSRARLIVDTDAVIRMDGMSEKQRQGKDKLKQETAMAKKYRKDNATQRMDRDRLIPLLHEAFAEFKVWGIKTLNERVRQPESYLKEVLLSMAVLHARGDFNGKWELSDEYRASNADAFAEFESVKQGAVAPEALETSDAGEDVDDVDDGVFVTALLE